MKLIVISGRSGSGKSVALNMLEDLNYYCVDNLPVGLLPSLVVTLKGQCDELAVSIDARNMPRELGRFVATINKLKAMNSDCQVIYLDAEDSVLVKRFSETRRKHPLDKSESGLQAAIKLERQLLEPIAECATLAIDTSLLSVRQLREMVCKRIYQYKSPLPALMVQSFAYKRGVPIDTDFIFDVRCLPNPYWEITLRDKTGLDSEVSHYFAQYPQVDALYHDIKNFIEKCLPGFEKESRKYLSISLGCTGGQHRSVYLAEKMGKYFSQKRSNVITKHRELS